MSISVSSLTKIYGTNRVVDGVSFEVAKGELVSLLGPSGCGKTTTLRCIAGLEEANGGEIAIAGETVTAPGRGVMVPPDARDIGMVFQSYAVWPHMTVAENVGFPLRIRGASAAMVKERVTWALGIVGLDKLAERQPSQLSGGQQQRVALARAIVGRPRVLLFDEPLSNLDAKLRDQTRTEIRRLQKELDVAAVYVTHDQTEALSMSDRIVVMDHGHIMQEGLPRELYRAPANRFVADFIGSASFVPVTTGSRPGTWRLPEGAEISIDGAPPEGVTAVEAVLRPEAVRIAARGASLGGGDGHVAGPGANVLAGRIVEQSYLGPVTEFIVEVAGAQIKVHAGIDIDGDEVTIGFAAQDARLIAAAQRTP
jgi:ABC-type Fe3+/spermidine/putrescine transport system ATPase subunit